MRNLEALRRRRCQWREPKCVDLDEGVHHPGVGVARLLLDRPLQAGADVRGRHRRQNSAVKVLRRSEEHTSELQSLMRISYAVFCLKKKKQTSTSTQIYDTTLYTIQLKHH